MFQSLAHTGARPMIRGEKKKGKNVDVIYPTGSIVDVSVQFPKQVNNFLFSGFRIIRRAPVERLFSADFFYKLISLRRYWRCRDSTILCCCQGGGFRATRSGFRADTNLFLDMAKLILEALLPRLKLLEFAHT
jgi:hypothetical protein